MWVYRLGVGGGYGLVRSVPANCLLLLIVLQVQQVEIALVTRIYIALTAFEALEVQINKETAKRA